MSATPGLIGVDWGTTSFRAYLLSGGGQLLDKVDCAAGIQTVENRNFESALSTACGPWIEQHTALPILMCGMIGSRQGWHEVPYVDGNAGTAELAAASIVVRDGENAVIIIPGVQALSFDGEPDVMRGEETILMGAIAGGKPQTALYCLPGTHSKWISVVNGRICAFSTYMTGEVFAILRERSILGTMIAEEPEGSEALRQRSFQHGLAITGDGSSLLHKLFSIRAKSLTDGEDSTLIGEVLSGLLIGTELKSMSPNFRRHSGKIVLLSSGTLSERYRTALKFLGYEAEVHDAAVACVDGLLSVARELDLIAGTGSNTGPQFLERGS